MTITAATAEVVPAAEFAPQQNCGTRQGPLAMLSCGLCACSPVCAVSQLAHSVPSINASWSSCRNDPMLLAALIRTVRNAKATRAARHKMTADRVRARCPPPSCIGPTSAALATPLAVFEAYLPMNFAVVSQGFAAVVGHGVVVVGHGVVVVGQGVVVVGHGVVVVAHGVVVVGHGVVVVAHGVVAVGQGVVVVGHGDDALPYYH